MKYKYIKSIALASFLGLGLTSCEDFLNRPNEDSYNTNNYYSTDDQCIAGVNYLYNAPWYDFQRGFIFVGEGLSGNYIQGSMSKDFIEFSLTGTNEYLTSMSASLWSVIAHSNSVYNNIAGATASTKVKNQCLGECLTWKALSYFFLVRSFGEVPIIHDTSSALESGEYNTVPKVKRADIYEYIIMTLEKAIELLPETAEKGRLDKYSAKGLLAKVYLTKAGLSGTLSKEDLNKAAELASDVIENSTFELEENYEDIFLLKNRYTREGMVVWRWTANGTNWTRQNSLQADLGLMGLDNFGACWGDWGGFTPDCQKAFGVDLVNALPDSWINNVDTRLHATMMLPGFKYDQFLQDKGGLDYIKYLYTDSPNSGVQSCTGSNTVKHIYGDTYDHEQGAGCSDARMASSVPTFVLRFSDMYLILAEAKLLAGNISNPLQATTTDAEAIDAFYTVHKRAIKNATKPASISFDDIWKERRLEFCMEGDRWYDYVRLSYYEPEYCIKELEAQNRWEIWNLGGLYETYFKTGTWDAMAANAMYRTDFSPISCSRLMKKDPDSGKSYFIIPPYAEDVVFNPNLALDAEAVHIDVRNTYSY